MVDNTDDEGVGRQHSLSLQGRPRLHRRRQNGATARPIPRTKQHRVLRLPTDRTPCQLVTKKCRRIERSNLSREVRRVEEEEDVSSDEELPEATPVLRAAKLRQRHLKWIMKSVLSVDSSTVETGWQKMAGEKVEVDQADGGSSVSSDESLDQDFADLEEALRELRLSELPA